MTTSVNMLILGHGEMGQAMEYLLKDHHSLAIWEKFPRTNHRYISLEEGAPHADIALFCLPVNPQREVIQLSRHWDWKISSPPPPAKTRITMNWDANWQEKKAMTLPEKDHTR